MSFESDNSIAFLIAKTRNILKNEMYILRYTALAQ